ncbi:MAG: YeeE/YedE family protein [Hyphomicrobiaceae bacterium]
MTDFTPYQSLLGGSLIGLASVLLMAVHGRIAGATGILGGLLPPGMAKDWGWRVAFLGGMIAAPLVYRAISSTPIGFQSSASAAILVLGGVIVGIGVSYGSGCTSGHGVCGLARFSPRSLAATLTFMASTALTVFVTRHVFGG